MELNPPEHKTSWEPPVSQIQALYKALFLFSVQSVTVQAIS